METIWKTVRRWRVWLVMGLIALTVALAPKHTEKIGDRLQVALPMIAWGCAAANGQGAEYAVRFAATWIATHATKRALGTAAINARPHGGFQGFPSGHTSASVFGASSLVHDCLTGNPVAQGVVILSAGYVGGSRIDVRAHSVWQVLAGALYGWIGDRALRRDSVARARVSAALRAGGRSVGRGLAALGRLLARAFAIASVWARRGWAELRVLAGQLRKAFDPPQG